MESRCQPRPQADGWRSSVGVGPNWRQQIVSSVVLFPQRGQALPASQIESFPRRQSPMAIRLKCAHCGRAVAVTRRAAGTQVPCPVCRQPLKVPDRRHGHLLARANAGGPAVVAEPPPAERVTKPQASPRPRSITGWSVPAAAAAVGVLAVLTLVVARPAAGRRIRQWESSEASGRPIAGHGSRLSRQTICST